MITITLFVIFIFLSGVDNCNTVDTGYDNKNINNEC